MVYLDCFDNFLLVEPLFAKLVCEAGPPLDGVLRLGGCLVWSKQFPLFCWLG